MQIHGSWRQTLDLSFKSHWLQYVLGSIVVLLPLVQTVVLLQVFFSADIFDFVPATDDEVLLWHQTRTFNAVGFNGGYYTFEEYPAAFSLSHFAAHGPFFPLLYGTLALPFGWQPYTGAVINLVFISLAVLFFVIVARPDSTQLIFLAGILATFWVIAYVIPDNSQEALHLSIGIVLAAVLSVLLRAKRAVSPLVWLALVILILAVSLLRPFWSLLLIPLALMAAARANWKIRILSLLAAVLLIGLVYAAAIAISAPYPYFMRDLMETLQVSRRSALHLWWSNLVHVAPAFFGFGDPYVLSIIERYQILGILAVLVVGLGLAFRKAHYRVFETAALHKTDLFSLYSLGSILLINLFFYIPYGYQAYRVFAPYLLMAVLLLLLDKRYLVVGLFIGIGVLSTSSFLPAYHDAKLRNFRFDTARVQEFTAATGQELQYDPKQPAWCNTVLVDGDLFCMDGRCDYLMAIPPGIGLSMMFFPNRLSAPLKSKYLLMSEQGKQVLERQIGADLNISPLKSTSYGTLYRNLAAACP